METRKTSLSAPSRWVAPSGAVELWLMDRHEPSDAAPDPGALRWLDLLVLPEPFNVSVTLARILGAEDLSVEGSKLHPLVTDNGVRRFKPADEQLAGTLCG